VDQHDHLPTPRLLQIEARLSQAKAHLFDPKPSRTAWISVNGSSAAWATSCHSRRGLSAATAVACTTHSTAATRLEKNCFMSSGNRRSNGCHASFPCAIWRVTFPSRHWVFLNMDRLPSLNALRAFERVARTGTVRAAAEQLHVTPSAISHQLKRLEQELGILLIERSTKSITLTAEGAAYFRDLRQAFDLMTEATARIRHSQGLDAVAITTLPVFAIKWLVRKMADFHAKHPSVEVRLGTAYRTQDLAVGGYDLGIRWGSGRWPGLSSIRLLSDSVQPVCSPSFLQQHGPLDESRSDAAFRLIHMGAGRDDWHTWYELQGHKLSLANAGLQISEPTSAIQAAVDGLGIVLGPGVLIDDDLASGRLVPASNRRIQLHDAYHLVHPARTGLSRTGKMFRDWLIEKCHAFEAGQPPSDVCLLNGTAQQARLSD